MLMLLLACSCLVAITVAVHTIGLVAMLRWVMRSPAMTAPHRTLPDPRLAWLLVRVVWGLMALHVFEVGIWAAFYWWQEALPDIESALYFSGVTYSTIGYGDLLLPLQWRFLGPLEGLTGILMCGLSTAFFFATLTRIHGEGRVNPMRP